MPPDISPGNALCRGDENAITSEHNLEVGKLPTSLLSQQLWLLLSRGTAVPSGRRLTGNIYVPPSYQGTYWQATKATGLYSLNKSNWSLALHHLPQLAALTSSDATQSADDQPEAFARKSEAGVFALPLQSRKIEKKSVAYFLTQQQVGQWWQRVTRYPFFQQQVHLTAVQPVW